MQHASSERPVRLLVTGACLVVIIAGLAVSREVMIPLVVSVMLAVIAKPSVGALVRRGVGPIIAIPAVVLLYVAVLGGIIGIVGSSLADFTASLPAYEEDFRDILDRTEGIAGRMGLEMESLLPSPDPGAVMSVVGTTLNAAMAAVSNLFIIGLLMVFMLFEGISLPRKLRRAFGEGRDTQEKLDHIATQIQEYLTLKTLVSLLTGALIGVWVAACGLDYAVLWALVAFLLNFVPNVGSVIAGIPAVLLAMVQLGFEGTLAVFLGYMLVNAVVGNFVEPRMMGRGLGLSTLVVILSLVFWGAIWGPIGMLLAVPMTLIVKIVMESSDETKWLAVLLGPNDDALETGP